MKKKVDKEANNMMSKNPDNWKGIFYFNSKDPRMIVPKMDPTMGYTFNFGHRNTYIGIILIILILVAYQVFVAV